MRLGALLLAIVTVPSIAGCFYALHCDSLLCEQRLHIEASQPSRYAVRVFEDEAIPVSDNGLVMFEVPRMMGKCSRIVIGVGKLDDGDPRNRKVIHVLRDGKVIRKLSLNSIEKLPLDEQGYHVLALPWSWASATTK
jgi:hypothetical protein